MDSLDPLSNLNSIHAPPSIVNAQRNALDLPHCLLLSIHRIDRGSLRTLQRVKSALSIPLAAIARHGIREMANSVINGMDNLNVNISLYTHSVNQKLDDSVVWSDCMHSNTLHDLPHSECSE